MRKVFAIPCIALLAIFAIIAQTNAVTGPAVATMVQQDQPSDFGAVHLLAIADTGQKTTFAAAGLLFSTEARVNLATESEVALAAATTKVDASAADTKATNARLARSTS